MGGNRWSPAIALPPETRSPAGRIPATRPRFCRWTRCPVARGCQGRHDPDHRLPGAPRRLVVDWAGWFASATDSSGTMTLPSGLPQLPADHAARLLALTHLEAARAARARLVDPGDVEALHAYRGAPRRRRGCPPPSPAGSPPA